LKAVKHSEIAYDIAALLTLLPTEKGGRQKPVYTGYKPSFAFNTVMQFSGEIELLTKEELSPGELADVRIRMMPSSHIRQSLKQGDTFSILEGNKIVGTGIIREINKKEVTGFNKKVA